MQSHSAFISLQWGFTHQQNSTAAGPDSKQVLHRWICMRYAKTAQGSQTRFSAVDVSRKWWNWFNLNIFLLLSTWQKRHLFLTTHFNQISRKMLRSAYKNNERNYFTEFFKYRNHKRSESFTIIEPIWGWNLQCGQEQTQLNNYRLPPAQSSSSISEDEGPV
jgi:hypothetical protein